MVFSIVHIAVITGEAGALKLITEMFRKIGTLDILDDQNKARKTALHLSTELGQSECVRILLDCQASADRLDQEGETPVHIAVRNNDLQTLRCLLSFKVQDHCYDEVNISKYFFISIPRPTQTFPTTLASSRSTWRLRTTCCLWCSSC